MPYNTVVAPSTIFPEQPDTWPPVWTSESRSAYGVVHSQPPTAPQSYRGKAPYKPEQTPAAVIQPALGLLPQLQSLNARLLRLQKQLNDPSPTISQASLDAVAAQLAALEGLKSAAPAPCCEQSGKKPSMTGSFSSFAQFAAEAARVKNAGRLPFSSDDHKIRP